MEFFRKGLISFRPVLFGLVLTVLLLVGLEVFSYTVLTWTHPRLARLTDSRHPWLNERRSAAVKKNMHPLWGWGDPSVRVDPSADVHLVMLGGSTVWGGFTPNRPSIPARLEARLNRRLNVTVQVINAGQPGWTSVNELAYLSHRVLPFFIPDGIVVLDGSNDVHLALEGGILTQGTPGEKPMRKTLSGTFPQHPELRRFREQFESLQEDPGFVLNQLIHLLGFSRYLKADRYYTGALLGGWFHLEALRSQPAKVAEDFWERFILPREARRRLKTRLKEEPSVEEFLRDPDLMAWKRKAYRAYIAYLSDREWRRVLARIRDVMSEQRDWLVLHAVPATHHSLIREGRLPCRRSPLKVDRYLANVRTMIGIARAHGVPILHALQPTIVHKRRLTAHEKREFQKKIAHHLYARSNRFPAGTCWHEVTRRFFRRARSGFQRLDRLASPMVRLLDLSGFFSGDRERRFNDFVHYSETADEEIAEVLAGVLESWDFQEHEGTVRRVAFDGRAGGTSSSGNP